MNSNRQIANVILQVALVAGLLVLQSNFSAEAQRRGGGGGGRAAAANYGGGGGARASARTSVNQPAARPATGGGNYNRGGNTNTNVNRNINNNTNTNINRNINNNTNINRDVNINNDININNDYHGNHWNDWDDHPFATAAAITAGVAITSAVIGSIVYSVPPSCVTTVVNGIAYQQCGSTWYQPRYSGTTVQYVVINAP